MCWICLHPDASRQDYLDHVQGVIDRDGWFVQAVQGTRLYAPLAYTVGLTARGLPELVVTGRRAPVACSMLCAVADYTHDQPIRPGETVHLGEVHLEVVAVPHPEAHLFTAAELYGADVRGLQLVWADERGRLPWEVGHRGGRGGQPVLGQRSAIHQEV